MVIYCFNLKIIFRNKTYQVVKVAIINKSYSKLLKLFNKKVQQGLKSSKQDFYLQSASFVFAQILGHHETLLDLVEHIEKRKGLKFIRQIDLALLVKLNESLKIDLIKDFAVRFVNAEKTVNVTLANNHLDSPVIVLQGAIF